MREIARKLQAGARAMVTRKLVAVRREERAAEEAHKKETTKRMLSVLADAAQRQSDEMAAAQVSVRVRMRVKVRTRSSE